MKSSPRFPGALCAGLLIVAALLSSCARADDEELTVFVAASMHEVMEEIADDFTAETGTSVRLQAAGSATLVEQLSHGADGDVLITADEHWMSKAAEEGLLAGRPREVAGNEMVLAVPDGNPASVGSLQDVEDDDVDVVVCAPHVPCGRVAEDLLAEAGARVDPVSEELSVTDVLARLVSGEADAGLIYATDAQEAAQRVEAFEIPGADQHPNRYPAAVLRNPGDGGAEDGGEAAADPQAEAFLDFLLSEAAQQRLREAGFGEAVE